MNRMTRMQIERGDNHPLENEASDLNLNFCCGRRDNLDSYMWASRVGGGDEDSHDPTFKHWRTSRKDDVLWLRMKMGFKDARRAEIPVDPW